MFDRNGSVQVQGCLRDNYLLYGEFSTLTSQHVSPCLKRVQDKELTARTRNNDVLPAFCKPIMVTSISVALETSNTCQQRFQNVCRVYGQASCRDYATKADLASESGGKSSVGEGGKKGGRRTRRGAAANHICSGRCWPLLSMGWIELYPGSGILNFWGGNDEGMLLAGGENQKTSRWRKSALTRSLVLWLGKAEKRKSGGEERKAARAAREDLARVNRSNPAPCALVCGKRLIFENAFAATCCYGESLSSSHDHFLMVEGVKWVE